jgi:prepilin-type N-terminal cleavage/methylation domain-containing protein/prepilin-type processing-associated H-X9-DG protein
MTARTYAGMEIRHSERGEESGPAAMMPPDSSVAALLPNDSSGRLLSSARPVTMAARRGLAFTLVELLVVIAIVGMLMGILLPSLGRAQSQARRIKCAANLRQLGHAFHMYASDYAGQAMPLACFHDWPITYWFGRERDGDGVDQTKGFVWPYLHSDVCEDGVCECPEQPLGTIDQLQGAWGVVTSTYGYNGYFLAPASTPGWAAQIGHRPWQNLDTLDDPQKVFVFADTMIDWFGELKNCALLDPPFVFERSGHTWERNPNPTTSFRHDWLTNALHADGHVESLPTRGGAIQSDTYRIASVGSANDPHYVPDWREW